LYQKPAAFSWNCWKKVFFRPTSKASTVSLSVSGLGARVKVEKPPAL
jgi:hypothetical protein